MTVKNLVASVSYLEFINKITSLFNKLLYNSQDGYIYLKSKDAIVNAQNVVKKFNHEAQYIKNSFSFYDDNDFISKKKDELIIKVKEHYNAELINWADDIFEEFIDNLFLELSLDKNKVQKLYNSMICAINWIAEIKQIEKSEYSSLLEEFSIKFNNVLEKDDTDYLPKENILKSNHDDFIQFWDLILKNTDDFLQLDFNQEYNKLNQEDIRFFQTAQNNLRTIKKTIFLDEMSLIKTALEELDLKENSKKYDFIKQINSDFIYFLEQNKTIKEEDKVKLLKRRIAIFKDDNSKVKSYFKKLLAF
ncbi:MAG: hypothetical protein E7Z88_05120 [Cyanobacteria bacterium SIG27]|nr:hypothetical protein [Cyanobacteria bacterium SIG27]